MTPNIYSILAIQAQHKVDLINAGLSQEQADQLSGEIIQNFLDSTLLCEELREEIANYTF